METKRNKIGFMFYKEQETTVEETINPMEQINTMQPNNEVALITPAHKEVLERMEMIKSAIASAKFSTYSEEKKQEFLNELIWLTELNAQLTFNY